MNIWEWMCLNVDKLVEAVKIDGKLSGPNVDPLLDEAWRQYAPGRTRDRARDLLKIKLEKAGFPGLLS